MIPTSPAEMTIIATNPCVVTCPTDLRLCFQERDLMVEELTWLVVLVVPVRMR